MLQLTQHIQLQNANEILCWMLQLTQHIQLQNTNKDFKWNNYKMNANKKKVGPTPLFCTKRPLAGNLYCSPSPPLYVAVIWSRIHLMRWIIISPSDLHVISIPPPCLLLQPPFSTAPIGPIHPPGPAAASGTSIRHFRGKTKPLDTSKQTNKKSSQFGKNIGQTTNSVRHSWTLPRISKNIWGYLRQDNI